MSHDVAFVPASSEDGGSPDLIYREQSSCSRGLLMLMQDASPRATPARRQFLLACFRDTVSAYLAADRLAGSATFMRERVIAFDQIARAVDTRLDDFEELGIFVVLRERDCLYALCARGASARVRWRGGFVPLAAPEIGGVSEVSIETARAQHDLFAQTLPETLALYRIAAAENESGARELLLGGNAQDMNVAMDLADRPRADSVTEVPVDLVRHGVLMLTLNATPSARAHATIEPAARTSMKWKGGRARTALWSAATIVVVAVSIAGVTSWRSSRQEPAAETRHAALKQTPVPPPPQKRVIADVEAEQERAEEKTRAGFAVAWQQSFRAAVTSSPAVAGDAVIFGGRDGRVYSVHRGSGEKQWTYTAQGGVGASPVVRGATVIAADYGGNVIRLRAGDGRVVWKRALREKIVSTPAVTDERVLVGTVQGRIYALSLDTGRVLWKFSARGPVRGGIAHAAGTFIVPSNDGRLYALAEETGARRWMVPLGGPVASTPASDGDIVVIGTARGDVMAIDLASGKTRWTYRAGGAVNSSLALVDGRVYAGAADQRLYCIEARNGELAWRFDTEGAILSRPFVGDGRVLATSYDHAVYCLDSATGALIDRYQTDESIFSSPLVVEGRVFFGNNAGRFYCLSTPQS
jgi:outer membrane protein assembly factor BamB